MPTEVAAEPGAGHLQEPVGVSSQRRLCQEVLPLLLLGQHQCGRPLRLANPRRLDQIFASLDKLWN